MKEINHELISGIEHKRCSKCHKWKPLSEFHKDKFRKDGLRSLCKNCDAEYQAKWYIKNRKHILEQHMKHNEEMIEYQAKYTKTSKGKLVHAKANAKRKHDLGFENLFDNPFPGNIPVDYHHISDAFVVALPRSLHKNHYGKNHRKELKPYVEGIYGISYIIEGDE